MDSISSEITNSTTRIDAIELIKDTPVSESNLLSSQVTDFAGLITKPTTDHGISWKTSRIVTALSSPRTYVYVGVGLIALALAYLIRHIYLLKQATKEVTDPTMPRIQSAYEENIQLRAIDKAQTDQIAALKSENNRLQIVLSGEIQSLREDIRKTLEENDAEKAIRETQLKESQEQLQSAKRTILEQASRMRILSDKKEMAASIAILTQ